LGNSATIFNGVRDAETSSGSDPVRAVEPVSKVAQPPISINISRLPPNDTAIFI
jgi:hypothetical protein